jgi:hypothetical protein
VILIWTSYAVEAYYESAHELSCIRPKRYLQRLYFTNRCGPWHPRSEHTIRNFNERNQKSTLTPQYACARFVCDSGSRQLLVQKGPMTEGSEKQL